MVGTNSSAGAQYACKCLNIHITAVNPKPSAADMPQDPDFIQVFVGEEGITIAHTPITVRTRTRGVPVTGSSRFSRYTTITCLLCNLLVYRVRQVYSADVEGKDGPLLPTENWVERDILKSSSGWVEVHNGCLTSEAVDQAKSSAPYSSSFGLLLPSLLSPPMSPELITERPPSRSPIPSPPPPPRFFSNLPSVFLPPPYTPSHPVFEYLASYATKESQAVRDSAEDFMAEQMKLKSSEIQNTDILLRRRVDALWKVYKDNLSHIQQDKAQPSPRRPSSVSRERFAANGFQRSPPSTPNAIKDFKPTNVSRGRSFSPTAPRLSALSQSLASTSFHHPKAMAASPPPTTNRSPSNDSSHSDSYTLGSSTVVNGPISVDATNVLKVRRNISEGIDTATSYRYFVTLEEDMARMRGRRQVSDRSKPAPDQIPPDSSSHPTGGKNADSFSKEKQPSGSQANVEKPTAKPEPSRGREKSKGNRKVVTFEPEPAVVTIKREVTAEKEEEDALANQEDTDLIFDFEDLEGSQGSPSHSQPVLLLVEQPTAPNRPRRHRPREADGLTASFSGLRPASLPGPSHVRPPRSQHGSDLSSPSMVLSLPKSSLLSKTEDPTSATIGGLSHSWSQRTQSSQESLDPQDSQSAVVESSHLKTRKTDSKAWQMFKNRQPGHEAGTILEEGEDIDASGFAVPQLVPRRIAQENTDMFIGSLAIPIKQSKRKETLSLASYQPRTIAVQPDQAVPTSLPSHKQPSSTAIRKAIYAERDRSRSLDPGPLDFPRDDDGDEEQDAEDIDEEGETHVDISSAGGRSRKAALKILKARSEVPEAGMWRSLAS